MLSVKTPLRPAAARRREAIREVARRLFLREGFSVSIERIAEEANVSRRTVFNLFGSKAALFSENFSSPMAKEVDTSPLSDDLDIVSALRKFADNYARVALSDEMVEMTRFVYTEYQRFPELIAELATSFIVQMHPPVVAYLRRMMTMGHIVNLDCDMAAEQFLVSVLGRERDRLALGVTPLSLEKRKLYLDQMVCQFVRGMLPPAGEAAAEDMPGPR